MSDDLAPLGTRIRVKLAIELATPEELREYMSHALRTAGAPKLMSDYLIAVLCDYAKHNMRALMNLAGDLLGFATQRKLPPPLDEKLFRIVGRKLPLKAAHALPELPESRRWLIEGLW